LPKNGKEAVELWQKEDFDLILMDCQMPVLDGYQASLQIRELSKKTEYPWIIHHADKNLEKK